MSTLNRRGFLKLAGAAAALTLSTEALATENTFGFKKLENGYEHVAMSGSCGSDKKTEGKCGEGKCGADKKTMEGKCGGDKKDMEGKCGGSK